MEYTVVSHRHSCRDENSCFTKLFSLIETTFSDNTSGSAIAVRCVLCNTLNEAISIMKYLGCPFPSYYDPKESPVHHGK